MSIDLASVTAIDTHVHIEADAHGCFALDDELIAASGKYFRADDDRTPALDKVANYYRSRNMGAVVFTVDAHTATGHKALSSREIVEGPPGTPTCSSRSRPSTRTTAPRRSTCCASWSTLQGFRPDDPAFSPLYAAAADLGVPIIFHTGQTGIGAGLPGGRGIKLRYSDPMLLDDVAADHPGLTVIMAHPSVPWQDAAISVARVGRSA